MKSFTFTNSLTQFFLLLYDPYCSVSLRLLVLFSSNCFSVQQRKWSINIVADPQWIHETQNVHKSCLVHPASFEHGCVPIRLSEQCKTNQFRCETCSYLYVTVTQYTTWIDFDPKAFIHTHTDRIHRITSYNLCLSDVIYWISSSQWRFCHLVSPNTTYSNPISGKWQNLMIFISVSAGTWGSEDCLFFMCWSISNQVTEWNKQNLFSFGIYSN